MRRVFILLCLATLLSSGVLAVDVEQKQIEQFGLDRLELPEEAKELLPDASPTGTADLSQGLGTILSAGLRKAGEALLSALRVTVSMMAVVILCSLVTQMEGKFSKNAVLLAGTLAITLLGAGSFRSMVTLGRETLTELQDFSMLLLPALSAATVAGGGVTAGSAVYAAAIFVSDVLITAINRILIPALYAFLAVAAANAALGNQTLEKLRDLMKKLLTGGLKLTVFLFTGYISLSGILAGAGDNVALRAAKLAVSSAVPVVGGMISDASETVLVSARMLRNAGGIFGLLAVTAICLTPLLKLGARHLLLKLTAALCATVGEKRLIGVMEAVSDALGFLTAMTASAGFMLLVSCVSFLKVATG